MTSFETRVARVGVEGDAVATTPDGRPLFLRYALPGEIVLAEVTGRRGEAAAGDLVEVVVPSEQRVPPPCPRFGICGGCSLQHWRDDAYSAWKVALLDSALRQAGFAPPPITLARTPPAARRRMDLAIRRQAGRVTIGLHAARSADLVDITPCLVLDPTLVALLNPLQDVLARVSGIRREGSAVVNLLDAGPDILLKGDGALTAVDRSALTAFANSHAIPRISWSAGSGLPETACLLRPATTALSGVIVTPPPGAFLQASREGEAAIVTAVLAGLPAKPSAKARMADLYAGCGTLTLPLAKRVRVAAFEGDAAAAAALATAANAAGLTGRITAARRDLAHQPLIAKELSAFAAVLLDPPYGGAPAQIAEIARSGISDVIYVSCNPAALARDARVLNEAGYRLHAATAVDQFLWSARLESVSVFRR